VDTLKRYVIPLSEIINTDEKLVGGKAYKLSQLLNSGYKVPNGFAISIDGYLDFVRYNRLQEKIAFELGRKAFDQMRWEEIWDAALRIRTEFLKCKFPPKFEQEILVQLETILKDKQLVARSSSPKEDSSSASFAGLHESIIGIKTPSELLKSIKQVWASLWSDGALLYQHELRLDPMGSTMAVLVQELINEEVSGVAFGTDPRNLSANHSIVEAVPGLCENLVDGTIDPDRWILDQKDGKIIEFKKGDRIPYNEILESSDISLIFKMLTNLNHLFNWTVDTEWTGKKENFTFLQARPITTTFVAKDDQKAYYLTLRPGEKRLKDLADKVSNDLIPKLEEVGHRLAAEKIIHLNNNDLAKTIIERNKILQEWKEIYKEYFIPFAHGVRHLAQYYNDAVQPNEPYEFVGLLKGQKMIASERNSKMIDLSEYLLKNPNLRNPLIKMIESKFAWTVILSELNKTKVGQDFLNNFDNFSNKYLDISYGQERLNHNPLILIKNIIEMSKRNIKRTLNEEKNIVILERKLFTAVGSERIEEAQEIVNIGRLSWRLRDDDNLLIGKVESQVLNGLDIAVSRLKKTDQIIGHGKATLKNASVIAKALISNEIVLLNEEKVENSIQFNPNIKVRQLVGQPAGSGLSSGFARVIKTSEDLGKFKAGEILVCDAIQPTMTHLVPLASAIVERRGGMLIHGAIIAREMGIPCVNGVPHAAEYIDNGDLVTVDGYLGIVTLGAAEFDLELNYKK